MLIYTQNMFLHVLGHMLLPVLALLIGSACPNSFNNNNNEILIKRKPLVYTRARRAVQKNKTKISLRLAQKKLKNKTNKNS